MARPARLLAAVVGVALAAGCGGNGGAPAARPPHGVPAAAWAATCRHTRALTADLDRIEHGQLTAPQVAARLRDAAARLRRDAAAMRAHAPGVADELSVVGATVGRLAAARAAGGDVVVPLARVFEALSRLPPC